MPKLVEYEDSQRALVLLRMCFAQKFVFWLRTVVPGVVQRDSMKRWSDLFEECWASTSS